MRAARAISWYFPGVAFLRTVGIGAVLFFGGRRVIAGDLTFGSLVSFLLYLDWFFQPIINLSNIYNQMQSARGGSRQAVPAARHRPSVSSGPTPTAARPDAVRGEIDFEDVSFGYDPVSPVVKDVDLADRRRGAGRHRRRDRGRQVDARQAADALLRPDGREGARRRTTTCGTVTSPIPARSTSC